MAFLSGTAANQADLIQQLVGFLTTNSALVAAGQQWELLFDATAPASGTTVASRGIALKGPGLDGADEVFIGLVGYGDTAGDWYNLRLCGGVAFNAALATPGGDAVRTAFLGRPTNITPQEPQMLLWDQPMPFWCAANGRRVVLVVKVSTVYESGYLGLIRPPCPPSFYPYPLVLAGSYNGGSTPRWSVTDNNHCSISTPAGNACLLRGADGAWAGYAGGAGTQVGLWPWGGGWGMDQGVHDFLLTGRDTKGFFPSLPLTFLGVGPQINGEMDGVFWVPAMGGGAEDTIEIDGVDCFVSQSAWRTGNPYLFAMRMS